MRLHSRVRSRIRRLSPPAELSAAPEGARLCAAPEGARSSSRDPGPATAGPEAGWVRAAGSAGSISAGHPLARCRSRWRHRTGRGRRDECHVRALPEPRGGKRGPRDRAIEIAGGHFPMVEDLAALAGCSIASGTAKSAGRPGADGSGRRTSVARARRRPSSRAAPTSGTRRRRRSSAPAPPIRARARR